ncbi:MAG: sugar phosphate isomerase/epimerase [Clostridia bacterium]|nr:sugar phosphate isomerase/epimerase [Clostridia bacterium]
MEIRGIKRGIRGHDLKANSVKQIAEKCESLGIEYLQLVLEKTIPDFEKGKFSEKYAEQIKVELGDTKLALLGSYVNLSNPDIEQLENAINAFKEKIHYASILKPIVVGTETGIYIEGKTHTEEAYQYLFKNIKELVKEAEKYNVTIGIELVHHFVVNSPETMNRLIDDINSPNIKVVFDPCNLMTVENHLNQDEIINSMFDLLSDKIAVFHAKDFIIENNEIKKALPGEGLLNYKLIFDRLNPETPIIMEGFDEEQVIKAFLNLEKINNK